MDLIDIFRTLHSNTEEYTFFSSAHGTFSRIDHILGHFSIFKKTSVYVRKLQYIRKLKLYQASSPTTTL